MSAAARHRASALLEFRDLTLLRLEAASENHHQVPAAVSLLAEAGLNLEFVSLGTSSDGGCLLSVAIQREMVERLRLDLPALYSLLGPCRITELPEVAVVGVYGPHFREKPGVLGCFLQALGSASVPVHAVASSVSSVCVAIPEQDLRVATRSLRQAFQLP